MKKTTCKECGKMIMVCSFEEELCFSCKKKKYRNDAKRNVENGEVTEFDCEDEIYCPYCGEVYEIEDEYELYIEGEHEVECPFCERAFTVNVNVSYSYDTRRAEDGDDS